MGGAKNAAPFFGDVEGYFAWSLLDNLEWSLGHPKRFGIVQVDFATLEQMAKAIGWFYADGGAGGVEV